MQPSVQFTSTARTLGLWSAVGFVGLSVAYAVTLAAGLASLVSPQDPVGGVLFSVLEILILMLMPLMVTLMVAVHAWSSPETKVFSLSALVFTSLLAGVTCSVHFVVLTVSHQSAFSELSWLPLLLSFRWPSVAYALDILAWDVLFPLAVLFAARVFHGSRLATWIRALLIASGSLALAGLSGVVLGDMRFRNIGIVGYAVVFPVVVLLLAIQFHRVRPREN